MFMHNVKYVYAHLLLLSYDNILSAITTQRPVQQLQHKHKTEKAAHKTEKATSRERSLIGQCEVSTTSGTVTSEARHSVIALQSRTG
jgi:hypothetical protein